MCSALNLTVLSEKAKSDKNLCIDSLLKLNLITLDIHCELMFVPQT